MNQKDDNKKYAQDSLNNSFSVSGEHGVLRAWHDGSFHKTTQEPTFCVDVVYLDRDSGRQERKRQRGLRADSVANICACVCLGEEELAAKVASKISEKFSAVTRH